MASELRHCFEIAFERFGVAPIAVAIIRAFAVLAVLGWLFGASIAVAVLVVATVVAYVLRFS